MAEQSTPVSDTLRVQLSSDGERKSEEGEWGERQRQDGVDAEVGDVDDISFRPLLLKGKPLTVRVGRPVHRNDGAKGLEEVVRVKLTLGRFQFYSMHLFLNMPSATEATPISNSSEFVSTFVHIPVAQSSLSFKETFSSDSLFFHKTSSEIFSLPPSASRHCRDDQDTASFRQQPFTYTTLFSAGISDNIAQLGLCHDRTVLFTFVPTGRYKDATVTIEDISIDLE